MSRRPYALALSLSLSLAACQKQEGTPPPAPVAPAPPAAPAAPVAPAEVKTAAALAVVGVETGTAVGGDMKVTAPTSAFAPTDTIIAAISLENGGSTPVAGNVGVRWTGPDGAVLNEESQAHDFIGAQTVDFRIAEPKGLKAGAYKLEVSLNGSVVQTREFSVK